MGKIQLFIFFLICFLLDVEGYGVSTCTDLNNNLNMTGYNYLLNNVDCSVGSYCFSPITKTFSGVLDGRGFWIKGLNINALGSNAAIFVNGNGASVYNLTFINSTVYAGTKNAAILFVTANFITISNVNITSTGNVSKIATFKGKIIKNSQVLFQISHAKKIDYAAGLVVNFVNSIMSNCIVENTCICAGCVFKN